jgi:hypothetical protein
MNYAVYVPTLPELAGRIKDATATVIPAMLTNV